MALVLVAGAAQADVTCRFETECFETEACGASGFEAVVAADQSVIGTEFGDLDVVHAETASDTTSLLATGDGAVYLLTRGAGGARLAVHMTDGPMMVTYSGACE